MMMSPLTFKEIFAATIEVCTVLLADFCVFPGACFLYILTNSRSVESNILLASLKPGKLGGLWQQEIFAATIEVCTVLLAGFCVFPDSCFF